MCDWGRDVPTQRGEGAGAVRVLGTERERGGGEPRSHTIAWAFPEEPNIWNSRNHADFLFSFFKFVFPSYFISQWRLVRFLVRRDGHCSSAGHAPRATASPAPPAPGGLCPLQKRAQKYGGGTWNTTQKRAVQSRAVGLQAKEGFPLGMVAVHPPAGQAAGQPGAPPPALCGFICNLSEGWVGNGLLCVLPLLLMVNQRSRAEILPLASTVISTLARSSLLLLEAGEAGGSQRQQILGNS